MKTFIAIIASMLCMYGVQAGGILWAIMASPEDMDEPNNFPFGPSFIINHTVAPDEALFSKVTMILMLNDYGDDSWLSKQNEIINYFYNSSGILSFENEHIIDATREYNMPAGELEWTYGEGYFSSSDDRIPNAHWLPLWMFGMVLLYEYKTPEDGNTHKWVLCTNREFGEEGAPPWYFFTPTDVYGFITVIPEPSTAGLGLAGLAFLFRRKRREGAQAA